MPRSPRPAPTPLTGGAAGFAMSSPRPSLVSAFRAAKTGGFRLYRALTLFDEREWLGNARSPCMLHAKAARVIMKSMYLGLAAVLFALISAQARAEEAVRINPTDPQPTCVMCPGTFIPASELESYTKRSEE